jgi:hypothetical protein
MSNAPHIPPMPSRSGVDLHVALLAEVEALRRNPALLGSIDAYNSLNRLAALSVPIRAMERALDEIVIDAREDADMAERADNVVRLNTGWRRQGAALVGVAA